MTSTTVPPPETQPAAPAVPPAVKGLSLVSLFNDVASEMVYPLLPAFVTQTLGAGAVALAALDRAADLAAALVKWASGRLADRPGWQRPLILVGYLTAVLVRPLMSIAGAAWQAIGFRVIDRVGKGLRTPPRDALIAQITPPPMRGRAFGFHRAADHLGAVLGSVAAWLLLERGADVRQVIGWSVVPGVTAFVVLAFVLRRTGSRRTTPSEERGGAPVSDATGRVFWAPVAALTALTVLQLPEALLILRLQDAGVAVAAVPLVWGALHVVRSAGSYPGGLLTDRLGSRRTVATGGILFAAMAALLARDAGAAAAIAAFLAIGLVAGLTEAAERSLVAHLAPVRTGSGFGAYHALTGLAALPTGLLLGWLYQRAGGPAALVASAAGVTTSVMVWLTIAPRAALEEPAEPYR